MGVICLGSVKCNIYFTGKKRSDCLHFIVSDACVLLLTVWISGISSQFCDRFCNFCLCVCVSEYVCGRVSWSWKYEQNQIYHISYL